MHRGKRMIYTFGKKLPDKEFDCWGTDFDFPGHKMQGHEGCPGYLYSYEKNELGVTFGSKRWIKSFKLAMMEANA